MIFKYIRYLIEDLITFFKILRDKRRLSAYTRNTLIILSIARVLTVLYAIKFITEELVPFYLETLTVILYCMSLLILLTLIIASITLLERKVLSLSQRRVGPNYVGYKGRLQYLADALKLFLKNSVVPIETNKFLFILCPSLISSLCFTFWLSSAWGLNIGVFEIEFSLVYLNLLSGIFSLVVVLTGFVSRNKYAFLASIRSLLMILNLEIILGLFFLSLTLFTKSLSIFFFAYIQETAMTVFMYTYIIGIVIIIFFLETNRAPFDLHEAESELISGYNTEYGGFFFALYYLGEYFHLFFFSSFMAVTILGFDNSFIPFYIIF